MPQVKTTITFSSDEIVAMLARESGLDADMIEIEAEDAHGMRFSSIATITVWEDVTPDDVDVPTPELTGGPVSDSVEDAYDKLGGAPAPTPDPEKALCKDCQQNLVREIKGGAKDGLPVMVVAPDGLCHFCKNPT